MFKTAVSIAVLAVAVSLLAFAAYRAMSVTAYGEILSVYTGYSAADFVLADQTVVVAFLAGVVLLALLACLRHSARSVPPALPLIAIIAFTASPLLAEAPKPSKEPVCKVATETFTCKPGDAPNRCAIAELWVAAMQATNENATKGDCSARKMLDDDLFVPLLAHFIYGEQLGPVMPKFRAHVVSLAGRGLITKADAAHLDRLSREVR